MKLGYGQKDAVGVSDTSWTWTRSGSVSDTVSDVFYWIGNCPLSGYVGGDRFLSLNMSEKLEKKHCLVF